MDDPLRLDPLVVGDLVATPRRTSRWRGSWRLDPLVIGDTVATTADCQRNPDYFWGVSIPS